MSVGLGNSAKLVMNWFSVAICRLYALFDSNIQYSEKDGKIQTITLFTKKYKLKNNITVGTDYSTVKHTYSSPTSNHYNNGKGTITYKYKEKNIQIKFTFKDKKISAFSLSKY